MEEDRLVLSITSSSASPTNFCCWSSSAADLLGKHRWDPSLSASFLSSRTQSSFLSSDRAGDLCGSPTRRPDSDLLLKETPGWCGLSWKSTTMTTEDGCTTNDYMLELTLSMKYGMETVALVHLKWVKLPSISFTISSKSTLARRTSSLIRYPRTSAWYKKAGNHSNNIKLGKG